MPNAIELELTTPEVPAIPSPRPYAVKIIDPEQLQALISLLASSDPAIVQLPEGKTFADVQTFSVTVLPNGEGSVKILF